MEMASSIKVLTFTLWLLRLMLVAAVETQEDCRVLRCKQGGPDIRFPFRLKGRSPHHCGYRGFILYCSDTNNTVLELPDSVKLHVSYIDYKSQTLHVFDPNDCPVNQLKTLNLSASQFQFAYNYLSNVTFFNCSKTKTKDFYFGLKIEPCPGDTEHQAVGFASSDRIDDLPDLSSCTKMYDLSWFPEYEPFRPMYLNWSTPNCTVCEARGKMCRLNKTNSVSKTECFDPKAHTGTSNRIVVTGGILGPFFLLLLVVVVCYIHRSNKLEKESQLKIKKFLENYKALKPTRYSYADIKKITNDFKEELGQGSYGTVYKGKISDDISVAVKVLNSSNGNGEEFLNEVGTMGRIHHVNVVRLVGFCADGFRRALVCEYLPHSLQKFISSEATKTRFLGWDKLQKIALSIAKGIEYLHQGCEQRILHFDIKPHNIMLDHNLNPKISDFGLAKLCSKDQSLVSMTTARGTIGYIAPEVFSRNFGNVSYKSDIYSFGMLLLEMVGGRRIGADATVDNNGLVYFPEWIYNLLDQGEDLRIQIEQVDDAKIAKKLAIVGLRCIQWHPVDRPSMKTVVQMLEGEGDSLILPPNPFASTASKANNLNVPRRRPKPELDVISEAQHELVEVTELD